LADYRVNLDIFAGPLDLLLYLVRKEEVDIYDIPIARITDQYLQYLEILKQLDIDLAGDFLVMAATLMEIKSAMLLPQAGPEQVMDESAGDPRAELIRQLLEYKKFKDAANLLDAAAEQHQERFGRPASLIDRLAPDAEPEVDMDQVSIWDLLEAFDAICKATGGSSYAGHIRDDTPIDLYQIEILHRLQTEGPLTFERIFDSKPNRLVMVGLFLAVLELIRGRLVWAEQGDNTPQIYLRALTDEPPEQAVQRAIMAAGGAETEARVAPEAQVPPAPPIPIVEIPAATNAPVDEQQKVPDDLPGVFAQNAEEPADNHPDSASLPEETPGDGCDVAPADDDDLVFDEP
jgi:segregation and condensation protein A